MRVSYNKNMYPKVALFKAAYNFTDDYYIYIDIDDNSYIVEITAKNQEDNTDIKGKFDNEMLVQTARMHIIEQTKSIRELIMARAFASTVIDDLSDVAEIEADSEEVMDIDAILTDWFENND